MNKESFKIPLKTHILVNASAFILIPICSWFFLFLLGLVLRFIPGLGYSYEGGLGFILLVPIAGLISWPFFVIFSTIFREIFGRKGLLANEPTKHQLVVYGTSFLLSTTIGYFVIYFDVFFGRP